MYSSGARVIIHKVGLSERNAWEFHSIESVFGRRRGVLGQRLPQTSHVGLPLPPYRLGYVHEFEQANPPDQSRKDEERITNEDSRRIFSL